MGSPILNISPSGEIRRPDRQVIGSAYTGGVQGVARAGEGVELHVMCKLPS